MSNLQKITRLNLYLNFKKDTGLRVNEFDIEYKQSGIVKKYVQFIEEQLLERLNREALAEDYLRQYSKSRI